MNHAYKHDQKKFPYIFLCGCIIISAFLTWLTIKHTDDLKNQRVTAESVLINSRINDQFERSATALEGIEAFVRATLLLDRQAFDDYTQQLTERQAKMGLLAFGFAPLIGEADRAMFVDDYSISTGQPFIIKPPGKRVLYAPLTYIQLNNGEAPRALGFDLMSNPIRKTALISALATGETTISSAIKLYGREKEHAGFSFIMVRHVDLHDKSSLIMRGAKGGFVTAAFVIDDFIKSLNLEASIQSQFSIINFDDQSSQLFSSSGFDHTSSKKNNYQYTTISFGGRAWKLVLSPAPKVAYLSSVEALMPYFMALFTLAISVVLSVLFNVLTHRKIIAEHLALNMTRKNRVARQRSEIALRDATESSKLMKESLSQLKALNASLNRYAAITAHDLRAPLKRVSSMVDILFEDHEHQIDKDGKDILYRIKRSTDKMNGMVSSLLTYSSSEFDENATRETTMEELVEATTIAMANSDLKSQLKLDIEHAGPIHCNPDLIIHVLQNLISNSLKFNTKNEVMIKISAVSLDDGGTQIMVADNGIGIPDEHANKIFEMFTRLHNDQQFTGHGIGLATCQRIVFDHGGSIAVDKSYKNGACIKIILPARNQRKIKQGLKRS